MEVRTDLPSFYRWRQERRYVLQAHKATELHLKSTRENHIRWNLYSSSRKTAHEAVWFSKEEVSHPPTTFVPGPDIQIQ